jgi:hypothetical protein
MLTTKINCADGYKTVRARTVENLFRRVARLYGGTHCTGRINGWSDDGTEYQVTICKTLPRRINYGISASEVLAETSFWVRTER